MGSGLDIGHLKLGMPSLHCEMVKKERRKNKKENRWSEDELNYKFKLYISN
jgi:hypothetical protein